MRLLRIYQHMAQKMYSCDNCHKKLIFPGDVYQGEVFVHNHRVIVKRRHIVPDCMDLPDPDEIMRTFEEMDGIREGELFKQNAYKSLENVA